MNGGIEFFAMAAYDSLPWKAFAEYQRNLLRFLKGVDGGFEGKSCCGLTDY